MSEGWDGIGMDGRERERGCGIWIWVRPVGVVCTEVGLFAQLWRLGWQTREYSVEEREM